MLQRTSLGGIQGREMTEREHKEGREGRCSLVICTASPVFHTAVSPRHSLFALHESSSRLLVFDVTRYPRHVTHCPRHSCCRSSAIVIVYAFSIIEIIVTSNEERINGLQLTFVQMIWQGLCEDRLREVQQLRKREGIQAAGFGCRVPSFPSFRWRFVLVTVVVASFGLHAVEMYLTRRQHIKLTRSCGHGAWQVV